MCGKDDAFTPGSALQKTFIAQSNDIPVLDCNKNSYITLANLAERFYTLDSFVFHCSKNNLKIVLYLYSYSMNIQRILSPSSLIMT